MLTAIQLLVKRDAQLGWRSRGQLLHSLSFYALIALLFPLALSPSAQLLSQYAPGFIWIALLLSSLISLQNLYLTDQQDGTLELWALQPFGLLSYSLGTQISHWLLAMLPLIVITPLLASSLSLSWSVTQPLIYTLLLGSPALTLIGSFAMALTQSLPRGRSLLPLLMLPLSLPVLIFATHAVEAAGNGLPYAAQLYFLAAFSLLSLCTLPFATAAALKIGL